MVKRVIWKKYPPPFVLTHGISLDKLEKIFGGKLERGESMSWYSEIVCNGCNDTVFMSKLATKKELKEEAKKCGWYVKNDVAYCLECKRKLKVIDNSRFRYLVGIAGDIGWHVVVEDGNWAQSLVDSTINDLKKNKNGRFTEQQRLEGLELGEMINLLGIDDMSKKVRRYFDRRR